jgi:hypothetical protein
MMTWSRMGFGTLGARQLCPVFRWPERPDSCQSVGDRPEAIISLHEGILASQSEIHAALLQRSRQRRTLCSRLLHSCRDFTIVFFSTSSISAMNVAGTLGQPSSMAGVELF